MAKTTIRLDWRGDQVFEDVAEAVISGLTEFSGKWEKAAKARVYPGHGVLTGTYRRSLHGAGPSYNFAADNVPPSGSAPERAGQGGAPEREGNLIILRVGSGMIYAYKVEDWYRPVEGGWEDSQGELVPTLQKHMKRKGY